MSAPCCRASLADFDKSDLSMTSRRQAETPAPRRRALSYGRASLAAFEKTDSSMKSSAPCCRASLAILAIVFMLVGNRASGQKRPDLNGIWQAVNTANWDIQTHAARPALMTVPGPVAPVPAAPVLAFGAVGAVPGGLGVVEGDEIPYQPWALAKKKDHGEHWLTADPEVKCYLPGVPRATYMPFPFQIVQSEKVDSAEL